MYEVDAPSSLSLMYNLANWPSLVINVNYCVLVFGEDSKLTVMHSLTVKLKHFLHPENKRHANLA